MPVNVPDKLPAINILKDENIFCMTESQAIHQDIRPLKIVMLNLMPLKVDTEIHFLRLLSNSPLQVQVQFLKTDSYTSKNTPEEHLEVFYKTFDEIRSEKFDGMIITGAPVEHMDFEDVIYWNELRGIMDWTVHNVQNTLHICWAAQAALYHHFEIPKYPLKEKMFGAFPHTLADPHIPLVRGFDDVFNAPHSRHTELRAEDIYKVPELFVVSESPEAGVYIVMNRNGRQIFVTGHSEYDPHTLKREYDRDVSKGLEIAVPKYYYPEDDPAKEPLVTWRSHANLLFSNWLNYYVYQETPYNLEEIS